MASVGDGVPQHQELLRATGSPGPTAPALLLCLRVSSRSRNSAGNHPGPGQGVPFPNRRGGQRQGRVRAWPPALLRKQPSRRARHHRTPGRPPLQPWLLGVVLGAGPEPTSPHPTPAVWPPPAPPTALREPNRKDAPVQQDVLAHLTVRSLSTSGFPFSAARRLGARVRREGRGWSCPTGRHRSGKPKQSGIYRLKASIHASPKFLSSCANTGRHVEHSPQPAAPPYPQISPAAFAWPLQSLRTWS